jgi:hypothetical protein
MKKHVCSVIYYTYRDTFAKMLLKLEVGMC